MTDKLETEIKKYTFRIVFEQISDGVVSLFAHSEEQAREIALVQFKDKNPTILNPRIVN